MYGIVYLWRDRKRGMFYVGSHWGTEDDGYICSSKRMNKAYKRRPSDFKRRILSRVYTTKKDLLDEEYKWLSKIRADELQTKYYNVTNRKFNHWSAEEKAEVKKTISRKTKEAMQRPDVRMNYERGFNKFLETYKGKPLTDETKALISKKLKGKAPAPHTMEAARKAILEKGGVTEETKQKLREKWNDPDYRARVVNGNLGRRVSETTKMKLSKAAKGRTITEEHKAKSSAGIKKRWKDPEYRDKVVSANKGRKHTEEAKASMSAAQKGKKRADSHKRKMSQSMKEKWRLIKEGIVENPYSFGGPK